MCCQSHRSRSSRTNPGRSEPRKPGLPTITVEATYPGASAQVVVDAVAAPIEQQVNGVEDMVHIRSRSTNDGKYELHVILRRGADLELARSLVENRVNLALPVLPDEVKKSGVTVRKQSADTAEKPSPPAIDFFVYGPEQAKVRQWAEKLIARLRESKMLAHLQATPDLALHPSLFFDVDHAKASAMGVSVKDILDRIKAYMDAPGSAGNRSKAAAEVGKLKVRNANGEMTPLSPFVTVREKRIPAALERLDLAAVVEISANPATGLSPQRIRALCEESAKKSRVELALPDYYRFAWQ